MCSGMLGYGNNMNPINHIWNVKKANSVDDFIRIDTKSMEKEKGAHKKMP